MRLLNVKTLLFKEFNEGHVPPYIIASHRWLADDQEATYKIVLKKKHTEGEGYRKVERFCEFVRRSRSDVEWLWIDTCCIDKSSSAELQESINSMFRWYRKAKCCLAFLNDVGSVEEKVMEEFRGAVWFSRAWTLQELLAPATVLFVNAEWERIGFKGRVRRGMEGFVGSEVDLTATIHEITGIPEAVLYDYSASLNLSFEEKQKWVVGRETTREEDKAYCLLGIFNISMPLVYGERRKAQKRLLKELLDKEGEKAAKKEKKKKWKGQREKEKASSDLQPIFEEYDPTPSSQANRPQTEKALLELLPVASQYEDECTEEHRQVAIISTIRTRWSSKGSRDAAIHSLVKSLENLRYEDPAETIHNAIHFVTGRAQQVQLAYFDMMKLDWTHDRAVRYMKMILQSNGHPDKIAEAMIIEYLMFHPSAVDPFSLPYIPRKIGVDSRAGSNMESTRSRSRRESIEIAGPAFVVSRDHETHSSVDAKLSGAGVARRVEKKAHKIVESGETFDKFVQMHLFC